MRVTTNDVSEMWVKQYLAMAWRASPENVPACRESLVEGCQ